MTNETQRRAEATLDELRNVTALVLPEPQGEVVALAQADAPVADEIRRLRMARGERPVPVDLTALVERVCPPTG